MTDNRNLICLCPEKKSGNLLLH